MTDLHPKIKEMRRLRAEGMTYAAIAAEVGACGAVVRTMLQPALGPATAVPSWQASYRLSRSRRREELHYAAVKLLHSGIELPEIRDWLVGEGFPGLDLGGVARLLGWNPPPPRPADQVRLKARREVRRHERRENQRRRNAERSAERCTGGIDPEHVKRARIRMRQAVDRWIADPTFNPTTRND